MDLAKRIKELRKENNLTQGKLAQILNISAQSVSKWENGQSEPDIQTIINLSKIFNITLEKFLDVNMKKDAKTYFASIKTIDDINTTFDDFIDGYLDKYGDPMWEIGATKLLKAVLLSLIYTNKTVNFKAIREVLMINNVSLDQGQARQTKLVEYFLQFPDDIQKNAVQVLDTSGGTFKSYISVLVSLINKLEN